ncbi:MBL fold metallo-hydrolase [Natronobacterium gregoryi]|uniref:Beta-lactamase n=2 Tax=Natronobacterium gregoryi TaxID=44930 RepID=L0AG45_NATGS|nr:MBL fold metallo-hydrolase [Natronobacterium gregoryi]AFZ72384.1 Zn-dependent hydrolase, glyoxylase [Natronobacterium gregoryi SP2]ELY64231.1 beta-lactamase [Natronobacterium gregoryi SP2]PLK20303.1 MBL fold metallo-hydrolase [Natronobacterium gregoryi SP2]SFJ21530.1 Glyoxylase, beta-lactamase superfamily II [Natronobacterium gregoryi]
MERISLSNSAFEGANNAYLFAGAETTLIDTGDWLSETREQLEAGLANHGVGFADVDRIFLTHWHHDHTGLAGEIQAESGADVYVHRADAPLVEGDRAAWEELFELQEEYFEQWGMPEPDRETLRDRIVGPDETASTPTVTPIEDGDTFTVGSTELEVVHASGHAAGLCLFAVGDEVCSGDALLPVYTPNVGGADVRVDDPLEKYLRALRTVADADYDRAWPGHRDPIDDPAGRAKHIVHHHEERAYRVLDALDRIGPCDTWTVSADLFGDLEDIHILHGPGESYAHLDHLERAGAVVSEGGEYRLAAGVDDELETIDDGRWPLES